jgi:hypothetical protein
MRTTSLKRYRRRRNRDHLSTSTPQTYRSRGTRRVGTARTGGHIFYR